MTTNSTKTIEGVIYQPIEEQNVRRYILEMAKNEWEKEDFDKYGEGLLNSKWILKEIKIKDIKPNPNLLKSSDFAKNLNSRIEVLSNHIKSGGTIPPLVLRGSDNLIFDGYARYHILKDMGGCQVSSLYWILE